MTTFDKRKDAYESKFAHDEALRFKAMSRRNKLLGLWAAERLGMTGPAADDYAREVMRADFQEAGDDDVLRKISGDLKAKGVSQSEEEIRARMSALLEQAVRDIEAES